MKFLCGILSCLLFGFLLSPAGAWAKEPEQPDPSATEIRGMLVFTRHNTDFPSRPGLSGEELAEEASQLVATAKACGFTSLVFEAVPAADALYRSRVFPASAVFMPREGAFTMLDPLKEVMQAAQAQGLKVYAMITPYFAGDQDATHCKASPLMQYPQSASAIGKDLYLNPNDETIRSLYVDAAEELLEKYEIEGILLNAGQLPDTLYYQEGLRQLAQEIDQRTQRPAGILLAGDQPDEALLQYAADGVQSGAFGFILPLLRSAGEEYSQSLAQWRGAVAASALVAGSTAERLGGVGDDGNLFEAFALNYQLIENRLAGLAGSVCSGYRSMLNPLSLQNTVRELASTLYYDYDTTQNLTIPTQFAITRPAQTLTTTYSQYFITGTSDPSQPVYFEGAEISDRAANGAFGQLVSLDMGENQFVFSQGGQTATVTIIRTNAGVSKITQISAGSAYPANGDLLFAEDGVVSLSCTAPAGATVTAEFAGAHITLEQVAAAEDGIPAVYRGQANLPGSYPADETVSIGRVTYTLQYNGATSSVDSGGELFVAGADARPSVQVSSFWGSVLEQAGVLGLYHTVLKQGANDYVVGVTDRYYQLACGGYLDKAEATINEGAENIANQITQISASAQDGTEEFSFAGTIHPAYIVELTESGVALTLFHTELAEGVVMPQSELFQTVEITKEGENTTLLFQLRQGTQLWGYDISCADGVLRFYCKSAPTLSDNPLRPLEGIHILLDPGHGGYDSGALGVAGESGPMEKQLNLAAAEVTKTRLESLGATVTMTRSDDTFIELDDRLAENEAQRPDFFLAMHHNSTAETVESSNISGVEVYYHTTLSEHYAQHLLEAVATETGRDANQYSQDYYRVTRSPVAPSALLEIGYLPNPYEYMDVCDPMSLYRVACAVSQAILDMIPS